MGVFDEDTSTQTQQTVFLKDNTTVPSELEYPEGTTLFGFEFQDETQTDLIAANASFQLPQETQQAFDTTTTVHAPSCPFRIHYLAAAEALYKLSDVHDFLLKGKKIRKVNLARVLGPEGVIKEYLDAQKKYFEQFAPGFLKHCTCSPQLSQPSTSS